MTTPSDTFSAPPLSWQMFFSWHYLLKLTIVVAGLFLFSTGIVLTYRSNIGLDPWNVLHQGISLHTPLSFGTAGIATGAILIIIGLILKVYPGVATILNMILVGIFIDALLSLNIIPDLNALHMAWRVLINIAGVVITGLGTALYILPRLGSGPRDGLMLRLHELTKVRIAITRTSIEAVALLIGFFLGGTAGIGTLIFALGIGPVVETSIALLKPLAGMINPQQSPKTPESQ